MRNRDDFTKLVKQTLADRVANRCSNPECSRQTSGPREDPTKVINIGVAAHITAASADGPRFDPSLTPDERRSVDNGIWLCQSCAKLVDNDPIRYGADVLRKWKVQAEGNAMRELEHRRSIDTASDQVFIDLEHLMPELLAEMRDDITNNPLSREFVLLSKRWTYISRGNELAYYLEDHPDLENKVRILLNHGLIRDITRGIVPYKVSRYVINEKFARYLGAYD